jgi:hypothetical protein
MDEELYTGPTTFHPGAVWYLDYERLYSFERVSTVIVVRNI